MNAPVKKRVKKLPKPWIFRWPAMSGGDLKVTMTWDGPVIVGRYPVRRERFY